MASPLNVLCWSEAEIPLAGHMKASNSCKIQVLCVELRRCFFDNFVVFTAIFGSFFLNENAPFNKVRIFFFGL